MNETHELLNDVLTLGYEMLVAGAEVSRVEDTITRILRSYDMSQIQVLTITSSIIVSARSADGELLTQTRRILKYRTDFTRLEALNALSREICSTVPKEAQLKEALESCCQKLQYPEPVFYLAYALISATFTVFFGGGLWDAGAAALIGLLLRAALTLCGKLELNHIITTFLCSAVSALAAAILLHFGIGQAVDKISIGNIMLLIPGIALTNAIRDMINGDTISGMLRLIDAVLTAIAIAMGFYLILFFTGI